EHPRHGRLLFWAGVEQAAQANRLRALRQRTQSQASAEAMHIEEAQPKYIEQHREELSYSRVQDLPTDIHHIRPGRRDNTN
ncbi:MAG: hypothetical protein ACUVTY_13420, partial [Armatimonadota bacterium]